MRIKVTLNHDQLVSMFCGRPCPRGPYAKYTGNQWVEDWEWDRDAVRAMPPQDLANVLFGPNNYEVIDE